MTMMEQTKKDMKEMGKVKYIALCVVTAFLTLAVIGGLIALVVLSEKPVADTYALTTKVVELDRENDVVVCEDFNGNLWEFYGCEDWQIDDVASLLMDDNGTSAIYDDEIVNARYNGTFEGWN